ncbi:hypothetical protein FSARC_317 [Fusarium sarcochroum]|uniref:Uncharacterized protein n=1 Tax=Fusarium sarcochroum TaxID=1208366 RepID=A0A8H4XGK7_9HYPO|nr:hypothetical protein FSARC_317 [Fusarium sarcochroum]
MPNAGKFIFRLRSSFTGSALNSQNSSSTSPHRHKFTIASSAERPVPGDIVSGMAEAFGIAGSAFGAISLGLQLFQQISQYLDDVEGRDEDLRQAKNYAKLVQTSLIALHGAVVYATTNKFATEDAINQCETSCAVAIDSLLKAAEEVKGPDAVSNSRITKAKDLYVKLKYPFKKQNIKDLEKRLLYTNNFLQTALTVLQSNNHSATHNSILSVQQTVNNIQLTAEDSRMSQEQTRKTSVQLHEALQFVQQDVREVLAQLREPIYSNREGQTIFMDRRSLRTIKGQSILDRVSLTWAFTPTGEYLFNEDLMQLYWVLVDFMNPATYANMAQGPYQRFDRIRDVPRIAEYLEYGQLSRAIIKEDQDEVQDWLERYPCSIKEINYLGQSPIHLAIQIQNVTILEILLQYADAKILNTADNNGHYPIDHATEALCHTGRSRTKRGSEKCNRCMILDLLLQSESALFGISVRRALELPFYHEIPSCKEGQKRVVKSLASRRKKLEQLAQRQLSPSERRDLDICQDGVLDQNAAQVQRYLEARSCHIPTELRVYNDNVVSEDAQSIYTYIRQGEIAEYALESGFSHSETTFQEVFGLLPRWLAFRERPWCPRQGNLFLSYICWMVDHGANLSCYFPANPVLPLEGNITRAHWFMTCIGTNLFSFIRGFRTPMSPDVLSVLLAQDVVDNCRCWCSPRGCTPLTKLLRAIELDAPDSFDYQEPDRLERTVFEHLRDLYNLYGEVGCGLANQPWVDSAILRYFTFFMLGLRHTCCCLVGEVPGPLSGEECREIREEDSSRLGQLEELVEEFETERGNYDELPFFIREYCVPKMRMVDQDLASLMLTEEQRREAEGVGVIWENYGPRLPSCSNGPEGDVGRRGEVIITRTSPPITLYRQRQPSLSSFIQGGFCLQKAMSGRLKDMLLRDQRKALFGDSPPLPKKAAPYPEGEIIYRGNDRFVVRHGNTVTKYTTHPDGMGVNHQPSEALVMQFAKEHTTIPVPEVISSDWDRITMEHIEGQTLKKFGHH